MKTEKKLLSIGFIFSILLLFFNDFYLKAAFPGFISGKLSDFAGLFALPFFISILFPSNKKWIYVFVGLGFIVWKLPITDNFIQFWNQNMFYSINRVVDYTDYIALSIMPISFYYHPNKEWKFNKQCKKIAITGVFSFAVFSFLATAGTHGKIKGYEFDYSKKEVNSAIQTFYHENSEYIVPEEFEDYIWHYGAKNTSDSWIIEANADSVSFHFFDSKNKTIFWTSFSGHSDEWYDNECELALIGYVQIGNVWIMNESLNKSEKKRVEKYFEEAILEKIEKILEN